LSIDISSKQQVRDGGGSVSDAGILAVTTIGTCRLAEPMAAAAKQHPMKRNLTNVYGFVHTTKEILQQLDFFEGREIPQHLVRFVASAEYKPYQPRGRDHLYFVEVSSLKEVHYREWLLQINCFAEVFEKRRELFTTFFRFKYASERDKRAEALEKLASFASCDPVERSILLEGYMHVTTRDELDYDLQVIAERIPGPVVFVCHIDVTDNDGKPIESRTRLCSWMRELCSERGYPLFDPTPQVVAYDRVRALAEEGRDNNHYTTEFKAVLGSLLFETYGLPLMEAWGAPGLDKSSASAEPTRAEPAALAQPTLAPIATAAPIAAAPAVASPAAPVRTAEPAPEELRPLLAEAKGRIGRGEMDEAEVMLRGAAIDHPGVAEIYSLLASVAYHRGDSTGALADLRHALRIDPSLVEPKVMLVRIAQRLNRLEEACAQALELVTIAPDDHKALTVAAKALVKAKRFHEASPIWRRVAMLRPDQATPLAEAARCELKGRNYDDAVKTADAALSRDPEDASALHIKLEALQRTKRMKEMAGVVLRIAVLDPSAAMATVPALIASSHHEEAAAVIAAVREQGHAAADDPVLQAGLVRSLTKRARLAVERHDAAAAAAAWMAVALIDPANKNAASGMRKLVSPVVADLKRHIAEGDVDGAFAACRRGLSWEPGNARLLRELANLTERTEDWEGAAKAWEDLAEVSLDPKHLLRAARAAARGGRPEEALRIYARLDPATLIEIGSAVQSITRKLVRAMRDDFAEGNLDAAVAKARHVQAVDPEGVAAPKVLGKALSSYRKMMKEAVAEGDAQRQEELARRILAIDPNRPDALKVLTRLYRSARRWREATEVLQQLVHLEPSEPSHWRKLASACRSARSYDLGVAAALRAVELEPGNARSLEFLSDILNRQALAA
jgi:tetratricopeptide (TPR) repeat protein